MALIQTRVDDINGAHEAEPRWAAISDGKKVYLIKIDLVDRTYGTMESAFKNAMSKYSVVGEASTVKADEFADATGIRPGSVAVVTEALNPAPAVVKAAEPEPAVTEKPKKAARRKHTAPATKVVAAGVGRLNPHYLNRVKRPGIRTWYERNREILGLPVANGKFPKTIEQAFDRYQGQDVTTDSLLSEDIERLTAPTAPVPTPKDVFSNGG